MREPYLTIGEVAKLANVSIQTLRYYDQIDLFKPAHIDENSNYRFYKDSQLYHLDLIKSLKHIGTSLEEIKDVQQYSPKELLQFLKKQELIIEERMKKLMDVHQSLLKTKHQMKEQLAIPTYNEIYYKEEIDERILAISTNDLSPNYIPNSYYQSLKYTVENEGSVIPSRYGCIFPLKQYKNIMDIKYQSVYTPLLTDRYIVLDEENMDVKIKRAGKYVCIAFEFDEDIYFERYEKLHHFILTENLHVQSDVYEVFMPAHYSPRKKDQFIVELKVLIQN